MTYLLHIFILIGIYVILSSSLNLLAGYTGILSIAHAAFYGVGSYVAALMALKLHTPFLLNLGLAVLASSFLGILVGFPSLRIKDDYFIIARVPRRDRIDHRPQRIGEIHHSQGRVRHPACMERKYSVSGSIHQR